MRTDGISCPKCKCEIHWNDLKIYGYGAKEILKFDRWLRCQNATLDDLEYASIDKLYWPRKKLHELLERDF